MKRSLTAIIFLLHSALSMAGSVAGTGGATEVTQLANNAQLALSYVEQASQTVTQMNQYAAMLRNLQRMTPSASLDTAAQKLWQDNAMTGAFRSLYSVVVNGQRMAYTAQSIDNQFRSLNPGNYGSDVNYQNAYRNWSDTTRSATESALKTTAVHAEDLQSEGDMLYELSQRSQSADGQMQALQAGNQIGVAMIGQMQKLRQLQMAQMQSEGFASAKKIADEDSALEMARRKYQGKCSRLPSVDEIRRSGVSQVCQ